MSKWDSVKIKDFAANDTFKKMKSNPQNVRNIYKSCVW